VGFRCSIAPGLYGASFVGRRGVLAAVLALWTWLVGLSSCLAFAMLALSLVDACGLVDGCGRFLLAVLHVGVGGGVVDVCGGLDACAAAVWLASSL
jgi:hypothetical protein